MTNPQISEEVSVKVVGEEVIDSSSDTVRQSSKCSAPEDGVSLEWQPIDTAPKDGTPILAWTVHENAKYSADPIAEGWACASVIRWIDFNGGGWTWSGLCGAHVLWMPLPEPPAIAKAVKP